MTMKRCSKIIAWLLTLIMVLNIAPLSALADGEQGGFNDDTMQGVNMTQEAGTFTVLHAINATYNYSGEGDYILLTEYNVSGDYNTYCQWGEKWDAIDSTHQKIDQMPSGRQWNAESNTLTLYYTPKTSMIHLRYYIKNQNGQVLNFQNNPLSGNENKDISTLDTGYDVLVAIPGTLPLTYIHTDKKDANGNEVKFIGYKYNVQGNDQSLDGLTGTDDHIVWSCWDEDNKNHKQPTIYLYYEYGHDSYFGAEEISDPLGLDGKSGALVVNVNNKYTAIYNEPSTASPKFRREAKDVSVAGGSVIARSENAPTIWTIEKVPSDNSNHYYLKAGDQYLTLTLNSGVVMTNEATPVTVSVTDEGLIQFTYEGIGGKYLGLRDNLTKNGFSCDTSNKDIRGQFYILPVVIKDDVTVSFNTNGASETIESITGNVGEVITLPDITGDYTGHELTGWKVNGDTNVYSANSEYTLPNKASITFTAVWANRQTVTFYANGGDVQAPAAITIKAGVTTVTMPEYNGTKEGYKFIGWSRTDKPYATVSTTPNDIYRPGEEYTVKENNNKLYAVWSGLEAVAVEFGIRKDGHIPKEPGNFEKSEYTTHVKTNQSVVEQRWVIDTSVNGNIDGNHLVNDVTRNLTQLPTDEELKGIYPTYDPETQYVQWYVMKWYEKGDFVHIDGVILNRSMKTVTYDNNTNEIVDIPLGYQVETGTSIIVGAKKGSTEAIDPVRAGYTFMGWNTQADGQGTAYQSGDSLQVDDSVTLYAIWSKGALKVTILNKSDKNDETLGGASFDLYKDSTKITALTSSASCETLENDTVYSLEEKTAPKGHATIGSKFYFKVASDAEGKLAVLICNQKGEVVEKPSWLSVSEATIVNGVTQISISVKDQPNQYDYTIHHYLKGTDKQVKEDETGKTDYGTKVSPVLATKYLATDLTISAVDPVQTVTVTDGDNVVTIYYTLPLEIKANNVTKAYGEDDALTATVTGSIDGDSITYDLVRESGSDVGTYKVEVQNIKAPEYYNVQETEEGTLTISKATAKITANATGKTYGAEEPELTATVEGVKEGDELNYTLARAEGENVGDYTITVEVGENANYDVAATNGIFTIGQKAATITAGAKSKIYGEADPALTATVSGLVDGDTLNYSLSRANGEDAGEYAITVTPGENPNYAVTVRNSTLTIGKKDITLTVDAKSKTYGEEDPAFTASFGESDLVGEETIAYTLSRAEGENVGEYAISTTIDNRNYNVTVVPANLTISQKSITLTAKDASKTYGDADPAFEASFGENEVVAGDEIKVSFTREEGEDVGEYAVTPVASDGNYEITAVPAKLTINPKAVTISTGSGSKTYDGTALTNNTVSIEGLAKGESVTLKATGSQRDAGSSSNTYSIEWTGAKASNYKIAEEKLGKLVISKRDVTLKSADLEKVYDGIELVNGENALAIEKGWAEGEGATYNFTGSQLDPDSSANSFSYTLNENTNADNYTIEKTEGTLTVTKIKSPIIITANSQSRAYNGQALTNAGYTYTEGVLAEGDVLTATVEGTITEFGKVANKVTGYQVKRGEEDVTENYTFGESVDGKLEILKKTVTLKSADLRKVYDATELVNGEAALETEDGWAEGEGATYTFSGSQTNAGSSKNSFSYVLNANTHADNYTIKKIEGDLTVDKKVITITADHLDKLWGMDDEDLTAKVTELIDGEQVEYQPGENAEEIIYTITRARGESADENEIADGVWTKDYTITVNLTNAPRNYDIKLVSSTLTITKERAIVHSTLEGAEKVYSGTVVTLTPILTGVNAHPDRFTYQWFYSEEEDGTYTIIPDATGYEYSYVLNSDNNGGYYRVEITLIWDGK